MLINFIFEAMSWDCGKVCIESLTLSMYPLPNGYRFSLLYLDVPAPRPALPLTVTDDGQHGHPSPPGRSVPPLAASDVARTLPRSCATMDASSWAAHEAADATTCSLPSAPGS